MINLIPFLATHLDFYRIIIGAYKTINLNLKKYKYILCRKKGNYQKSNILFFREIRYKTKYTKSNDSIQHYKTCFFFSIPLSHSRIKKKIKVCTKNGLSDDT